MTASTHQQPISEHRNHLHPPLEPSLAQGDVRAGSAANLEEITDAKDGIHSGDEGAGLEPSAEPQETVLFLADDRRYLAVLTLMQQGAWPDILPLLKELKSDYAHEAVLDGLLNEAQLKAEIVARWEAKIKGRRLTVAHERLLRRSLPFLIMIVLCMGGLLFYQNFIAPSRAVFALARTNQALIEDAQARFQSGSYQEAIALYEQVLSTEPANSNAQQGRLEAYRHLDLATKYDMAMTVSAAGNTQRAHILFESIHAKAPQFRDVESKLKQMQVLAEAQQVFDEAEDAYSGHRWLDAITQYEYLVTIAGDYQAEIVQQHLTEAYLHAGQQLVAQQPAENLGPEAIRDYFRQGMSADPVVAQAEIDLLDVYLLGEKFEQRGDLRDTIDTWRPLYDERPRYLDGYLAQELYSTYLALASQRVEKKDPDEAKILYEMAMELQVSDTSEAQAKLAEVAEQVATPVPTPVPPKPVAYAAPAPAAPTPTPALTQAYQGWIAFRTNRNGGEQIFIMRPDGIDQQPAPAEIASQFDALYDDERWSPDHTREAYVHTPGNSEGTDIYIREGDVGVTMLSDFPGHEYDPVWSPDGQWVAFVSNYTGNDEIWAMRVDGSDLRQLTANAWEWDKHPTWSPDSSQVAFFSNRTGRRQIWTITINGYQEWNASYSNFDDWDPIWIK